MQRSDGYLRAHRQRVPQKAKESTDLGEAGQEHRFYKWADLICATLRKLLNFLSLCFLMCKVQIIIASTLQILPSDYSP